MTENTAADLHTVSCLVCANRLEVRRLGCNIVEMAVAGGGWRQPGKQDRSSYYELDAFSVIALVLFRDQRVNLNPKSSYHDGSTIQPRLFGGFDE